MSVIAYDPYIAEEVAERAKVELVGALTDLLARADFVTLHTPLSDETKCIIGRDELARMKRGARLVNCARGGLVDETALLAALEAGQLAGAAMDVFSVEPPQSEMLRRLIARPDVVVTPHLGANTVEAQEDVGTQIARQVLDALRGENFQNAVNLPFVGTGSYQQSLPFLHLAEAMGSLHMQLWSNGLKNHLEPHSRGRISRIELAFEGDELVERAKPLTVAFLKGLLTPILQERVNYVNAPRLAAERGIVVMSVAPKTPADYSSLLTCRVASPQEERVIAGTLFAGKSPRIVRLDDYRMDGTPEGRILVMTSRDVPGVIGKVATLLGNHRINIAEWRLGRTAPGGMAKSFINVDDPVSDEVMEQLRALAEVIDMRQVVL